MAVTTSTPPPLTEFFASGLRFDRRAKWSVRIVDAATGAELFAHEPDVSCETASIGKVFLLIEVAERLEDGRLQPDDRIEIPEEHFVRDSGLLYRMLDRRITVEDAALLVGAVSDNLATNALISMCGLDQVRAVSHSLGLQRTELHDYIRDERLPGMPWTPSFGTARELAELMRMLGTGEVRSPAVSERVLGWLAAGTDTSMLADSLQLDPLAHAGPEYQGIDLQHKTGTTSFCRADIGYVSGPNGKVAYAALANWRDADIDLRVPVMDAMRAAGERVRRFITATERSA